MSPAVKTVDSAAQNNSLLLPLAFIIGTVLLGCASPDRANPHLIEAFTAAAVVPAVWLAVLFLRTKASGLACRWEFVPVRAHYIQAMMHASIFAYWGWYWRNVYSEFPLILSQVAFLYAFDALLTWTRGRTWRLGFGPFPIVFSANLFLWFRDDWYIYQYLMIAVAVLGKQFVTWQRDGRVTHIFNPSALTLTLVSAWLIATGTTDHTWGEPIAITQGLPPYLYTEIFFCGLVVQFFFGVTLMTFSAAAMLALLNVVYTQQTGVYMFVDSNIPIAVFLGLHLLMTDPATTPRRDLGKIIFGSLYGVGVFVFYIVFRTLHLPEFYDKLLIVPVLNLMTPFLDWLAGLGPAAKFGDWEKKVGLPRMNLAFIGCWSLLFLAMLTTGFVEAPHPGATIGFWMKAAEENRPHSVENLRRLLAEFDQKNAAAPSNMAMVMGQKNVASSQALGILYNQVGSIYAEGKFVPADSEKAARYFSRACELGDTNGCLNLAWEFLASGRAASDANLPHALAVLEKTAGEANNARMNYLMGYSYESGRGNPPDAARAKFYYERAASLGDVTACKQLAQLLLTGGGGAADHTAAARWLQKAADAQDGASCLALARLYHVGDGVPQDESKANALLEKACDLGVPAACLLVAQKNAK